MEQQWNVLIPPFRFAVVMCSSESNTSLNRNSNSKSNPDNNRSRYSTESVPMPTSSTTKPKYLNQSTDPETIFRGAYPNLGNFPFLKALGLSTIVSVVKGGLKALSYDLIEFCDVENITLVVIDLKDKKYPDHESVVNTLNILLDKNNLPAYIHCADGTVSTGCVVMALRSVQRWSTSGIVDEYCQYTKTGSMSSELVTWCNTFPVENVVVQSDAPSWYEMTT